ncbi:hypothetical protein [Bulleidia sp. zg-1006]|uniref:hypothetical protein n=1 Tax=Bulleidia sp. zg-1006 TaxID=2806552 RepID=UPI0019393600|nr:hypothetical protein [Bulleidia sp. zg-1006]QRG87292.1 hypothetical protein JOS54_02995 [Bulleidia sp. zg-1006]
MSKKEEKWYLLSMKLRYLFASFFSFVLAFSLFALLIWFLELFISFGPWLNLFLAIFGLILSAYLCPRILRIPMIKNWLNYDLNQNVHL